MANLNRCEFIGRVGNPPEARYTASGTCVASLSLAVSKKFKNKAGEQEERTEWIPCVFWGRLGEIVTEFVDKGAHLYVAGEFLTRKWTDKEGKDRYSSEINCQEMQMLDSKGSKGDSTSRPKGGGSGGAPRDGYEEPTFDGGDIPFLSGPSFYDHR